MECSSAFLSLSLSHSFISYFTSGGRGFEGQGQSTQTLAEQSITNQNMKTVEGVKGRRGYRGC